MAQYKDVYLAGQASQRAGKYAEARKDFEEARRLALTNTEKAEAQIGIALTFEAEKNYPAARTELAAVLAMQDLSAGLKVQAQMSFGRSSARGSAAKMSEARRAHADAIIAYGKISDMAGASPGQRAEAKMAIAHTLLAMKSYADARAELLDILEAKGLPTAAAAAAQLSLGKTYFLERNYTAARMELARALTMDGLSAADQADAHLHIGLSYYETQDYERAKPELQKVLTLPGANQNQTHEATLRLRLRKLLPGDEKVLTVLFIGASHTQGWRIPQIVEVLAASAPSGRPRIIAGEYLRGGTGISRFWEEGAGRTPSGPRLPGSPGILLYSNAIPFSSATTNAQVRHELRGLGPCRPYHAHLVRLPAVFQNALSGGLPEES